MDDAPWRQWNKRKGSQEINARVKSIKDKLPLRWPAYVIDVADENISLGICDSCLILSNVQTTVKMIPISFMKLS